MMLSMQYLNPRRPYKKPNFKSSNRNLGEKCSNRDHKDRDRRFSGTFIPEHHMIAMPTLATTNKVQHCDFYRRPKKFTHTGMQRLIETLIVL